MAEEGHIGGVDAAEVPIQGITGSLGRNTAFADMLKLGAAVLVQRQAQVGTVAQGLFLGGLAFMVTATGALGRCQV